MDIVNAVPYIQKFKKHPVTGQPLELKDLVRLTFHRNTDGEYACPVLGKVRRPLCARACVHRCVPISTCSGEAAAAGILGRSELKPPTPAANILTAPLCALHAPCSRPAGVHGAHAHRGGTPHRQCVLLGGGGGAVPQAQEHAGPAHGCGWAGHGGRALLSSLLSGWAGGGLGPAGLACTVLWGESGAAACLPRAHTPPPSLPPQPTLWPTLPCLRPPCPPPADEPFTRKDLIHLQDPLNLSGRNLAEFDHVKRELVVDEEARAAEEVGRGGGGARGGGRLLVFVACVCAGLCVAVVACGSMVVVERRIDTVHVRYALMYHLYRLCPPPCTAGGPHVLHQGGHRGHQACAGR